MSLRDGIEEIMFRISITFTVFFFFFGKKGKMKKLENGRIFKSPSIVLCHSCGTSRRKAVVRKKA